MLGWSQANHASEAAVGTYARRGAKVGAGVEDLLRGLAVSIHRHYGVNRFARPRMVFPHADYPLPAPVENAVGIAQWHPPA